MSSSSQNDDDSLSEMERGILIIGLHCAETDPVPFCAVPWDVQPSKNAVFNSLQANQDASLETAIQNLTQNGLISIESTTISEKDERPTRLLQLADREMAHPLISTIQKVESSDSAPRPPLAEVVEFLAAMIPPMYRELEYWWWSKSMLNHVTKVVDDVLALQSVDQAAFNSVFPSNEFVSLLTYLMWSFQFLRKSTLYGKYLSSCYPWISTRSKDDKVAVGLQLRMCELELARFCLAESPIQDIEKLINKIKSIQEKHKALLSVSARVHAFLQLASAHAHLSEFEAAAESIHYALTTINAPDMFWNPKAQIPENRTTALLLATICDTTAHTRLLSTQFDTIESLCNISLKIRCSILGREHITTVQAMVTSIKASNELKDTSVAFREKIEEFISIAKKLYRETTFPAMLRLELARLAKAQFKNDTSSELAEQSYAELLQAIEQKETFSLVMLARLATALSVNGKPEAALRYRQTLVSLCEEQCGSGSGRHVNAQIDLAASLIETGDSDRAHAMLTDALAEAEENEPKYCLSRRKAIHGDASDVFYDLDDNENGRAQNKIVLDLCKTHPEPLRQFMIYFSDGMHYEFEEKVEEANECYSYIITEARKLIEERPPFTARVAPTLVHILLRSAHLMLGSEQLSLGLKFMESALQAIQEFVPNDKSLMATWHEDKTFFDLVMNDEEAALADTEAALKLLAEAGSQDKKKINRLRESAKRLSIQVQQKKQRDGGRTRSGKNVPAGAAQSRRRRKNMSPSEDSDSSAQGALIAGTLIAASAVIGLGALWMFRSRQQK